MLVSPSQLRPRIRGGCHEHTADGEALQIELIPNNRRPRPERTLDLRTEADGMRLNPHQLWQRPDRADIFQRLAVIDKEHLEAVEVPQHAEVRQRGPRQVTLPSTDVPGNVGNGPRHGHRPLDRRKRRHKRGHRALVAPRDEQRCSSSVWRLESLSIPSRLVNMLVPLLERRVKPVVVCRPSRLSSRWPFSRFKDVSLERSEPGSIRLLPAP